MALRAQAGAGRAGLQSSTCVAEGAGRPAVQGGRGRASWQVLPGSPG